MARTKSTTPKKPSARKLRWERRQSKSEEALYSAIQDNAKALLQGVVISIDPSIGSSSSLPGYAVFRQGQLIESGTLPIIIHKSRPERLQKLAYEMRQLYETFDPDVLIYEEIPPRRYGGGNAIAHASLLNSLGVVLSISGPTVAIGMIPLLWKRLVSEEYVKGDEADAIEMGQIVIAAARYVAENDPVELTYGGKKAKKKPKGAA